MVTADAYLALSLAYGIGPVRTRALRDHFGNVEAILAAAEPELASIKGIGRELARQVHKSLRQADTDAVRTRAAQLGVTILTYDDPRYPDALREIYDPPLVLYAKGVIPDTWPRALAVVGSRQTTNYGLEMAKKLSYQAAYAGVPIASGLARGIDTAAHQGALAAKGVTWAVLGCGLAHCYPPENDALADKIIETGCLLSELPLDVAPDKTTFPMRNRIISGLSFGVLVIEAGARSGALITARQALEQGRQIFALPGRVDNPQAKGCHQLIKEGAKLVEGVEDILSELQFTSAGSDASTPAVRPLPENLSEAERTLFAALGAEEMAIDDLIRASGLPAAAVSAALFQLEMRKLVRQLPGKMFVRTA